MGRWRSLSLAPDAPDAADWNTAVTIFTARIRSRFLDPVDQLAQFDEGRSRQTFGFAILAIDFLVIETLQGFRDGICNHNKRSKELFIKFLTQWDAFKDCLPGNGDLQTLAGQVYRDYRCALHHSGATKGAFRVLAIGPMFNFKNNDEVEINRTCLHKNLKREFDAYLADLCAPDSNDLRSNFLRKMNAICGLP